MFNGINPIPPVELWGTLLSTNLYIAGTSARVNTKYGVHVAAHAVDKGVTKCKDNAKAIGEKIKAKKDELSKKVKENKKEDTTVVEEAEVLKAEDVEIVSEPEVKETVIDPEEAVTMDFSNAEKAVIYDNPEDSEDKPVTQEDLDAIMANINLSSNKKSK